MNLYSINFIHFAPKDSESGIKGFLIAESDEQVLDFFLGEPEGIYHSWVDRVAATWHEGSEMFVDQYEEEYYWENEESEPEDYRTRLLRLKGEMYDDDAEVNDAYYGVTHYGWSLVKENLTETEIEFLRTIKPYTYETDKL